MIKIDIDNRLSYNELNDCISKLNRVEKLNYNGCFTNTSRINYSDMRNISNCISILLENICKGSLVTIYSISNIIAEYHNYTKNIDELSTINVQRDKMLLLTIDVDEFKLM